MHAHTHTQTLTWAVGRTAALCRRPAETGGWWHAQAAAHTVLLSPVLSAASSESSPEHRNIIHDNTQVSLLAKADILMNSTRRYLNAQKWTSTVQKCSRGISIVLQILQCVCVCCRSYWTDWNNKRRRSSPKNRQVSEQAGVPQSRSSTYAFYVRNISSTSKTSTMSS